MDENITLGDTIVTALHNPDCAILVGGYLGAMAAFRIVVILFFMMLAFRIIDNLVIYPIINLVKKLFKKTKENGEKNRRSNK